jgi:eukaryotic-like serine/threonine-protein kinase
LSEPAVDAALASGAALSEGEVIGGKYRLVSELGVGAMGVVWCATHVTLGHQVAIKFLLRSIMSSDVARTRFDREAKLAARLGEASRHITRVIDHGVTEDLVPFLVMELLRGESLSARLKRDRRIPLTLATRIVQQLSRALHVAHSAGVVHRDLKPANVFLCNPEHGEEVEVKLLDFGVAKATAESDDDNSTGQGQILGTPSYMSPEQIISDKPVDARSDLWAVAAIVYRMVCGRAPFGSGPIQEIALRIMSTEVIPPSQVINELPMELDMWMQRGLAKSPEERFQTARELADFLAVVAGVTSSSTVLPRAVTQSLEDTGSSHSTTTGSQVHSRPPPPAKNKRAYIIAGAIVALAAVIAIVSLTRSSNDKDGPSSAASTTESAAPAPTPSATVEPPKPLVSATASASATALPTTSSTAKHPANKIKKPDGSGWGNKHEL